MRWYILLMTLIVAWLAYDQRTRKVEEEPPQKRILRKPRMSAEQREALKAQIRLETIMELMDAKSKYGKLYKMPKITLVDGTQMPVLAIGTAFLDPDITKYVIMAAIDMGYRAIDTANIYNNELQIGQAIKEKIEDGTVTRDQLYIMSKIWSTFHEAHLVEKAFKESLVNLGLEYVDLLMVHNSVSVKRIQELSALSMSSHIDQLLQYDYLDTWSAMEELVYQGLVKSIGLSNFNSAQIGKIITLGNIHPVINQMECHPFLSSILFSILLQAKGIKISCIGNTGSKGPPSMKPYGAAPELDEELVQLLATHVNMSPSRLLNTYQLQKGHAVVVKASTAEELWENILAIKSSLTPQDMKLLSIMSKNKITQELKARARKKYNLPFVIY